MAEQLTALDATFLELEDADPGAHMHIGGMLVFDAGPDGPPTIEAVRRQVAARLPMFPRYRCRLSEPRPHGLRWPSWVTHEHFDVADHVREAALPAPGNDADLCDWAAEYWSQRLDRRLPLWEIVLVEGLEHGRWALCLKTHHCLVDGVGSLDGAQLVLDDRPDPQPLPSNVIPFTRVSDRAEHHHGLRRVPDVAFDAVRASAGLASHPSRLRNIIADTSAAAELLVRDELVAAPKTSLETPIGSRRRYATVTADLDDLRIVRSAFGGTVNDVVLAAVTGGLRELLRHRGEDLPLPGMRAMVPVNVRRPGQHLGNHVSSLFVPLPVAVDDPLVRYRRVVADAEALKSGRQADAATALVDLASLAPPIIHATLARSLFATRLFNITVTNVPGPPQQLYAFGCAMHEAWPLVPLAAEHAVGVAVFSYDGKITFGLNADYASVPDLAVFALGLSTTLETLLEAAEPHAVLGR